MGDPLLFVVAAVLSAALTPVAAVLGRVLGLVDRPTGGDLKLHTRPVPVLGGLAAAVSAFVVALPHLPVPPTSVIVGTSIALAVGLADDVRSLPASVRFVGLSLAGIALAEGGLTVAFAGPLGGVAAVVLVLACTNAVNLVDGQDGLAGGLAAIAAAGLAVLGTGYGDLGPTLGFALAGGLAGFVAWNMSPVRIFLGNGGAYAIGTLLAALTLSIAHEAHLGGLAGASLCLGVFALELVFTVARRFPAGGILAGDRGHGYDLLARSGVSRTTVTFVFWGAGAALAGCGIVLARVGSGAVLAVPLAAIAMAASIGLRVGFRARRKAEGTGPESRPSISRP